MVDIFPNSVASKYFADDAKLYIEVVTGSDIDDLQFSLYLLAEWAATWQLRISFNKCSTIDIAELSMLVHSVKIILKEICLKQIRSY